MQPVNTNNNEYTTSENFRLSEERERRFIYAYIAHLESQGATVVAQIAPEGSKALVDALLRITENGRTRGEILEAKVRSSEYSFASLDSTFLTQSKVKGMTKMLGIHTKAKVKHITFYQDGAVIHDLTTFIREETELPMKRVSVKKRQSDPEGFKRYEWKFLMPHADHEPIAALGGQLFTELYKEPAE